MIRSFRPLAGIMVLIFYHTIPQCRQFGGFRPLAGIMVLIDGERTDEDVYSTLGFRPLAGIMVLINCLFLVIRFSPSREFPSPCGDYGSYLRLIFPEKQPYTTVSVPLRGLWFLSI